MSGWGLGGGAYQWDREHLASLPGTPETRQPQTSWLDPTSSSTRTESSGEVSKMASGHEAFRVGVGSGSETLGMLSPPPSPSHWTHGGLLYFIPSSGSFCRETTL
ncbi:hypothetical protein EYF80_049452 [Liparis tanakae]|uniref:Uncharacterized protein n=1 Tax=Liparis tanakae TaxID=230148 RepID=A0A4Z2FHZ7_9TELE|nr:hypothetical protein EYF80_049452 [Liparis tanakae]